MVVTYALTAFVTIYIFPAGFYLSLVASIMHGMTSSLGESTTLAYCKFFPSILIGAFSSGTGMSGILGTSCLLVFKSFSFFAEEGHEGYIFVIMSSTIILYYFSFMWLHRQQKKH
jgi:hypothetical protein